MNRFKYFLLNGFYVEFCHGILNSIIGFIKCIIINGNLLKDINETKFTLMVIVYHIFMLENFH